MTVKIVRYSEEKKGDWDVFVQGCKNATFLHRRDYMGYHSDRFEDHSLVFFNESEKILALLPGNKNGDEFWSHGGLTYGGFLTDSSMTTPLMVSLFSTFLEYLKENSFQKMFYKCVPHIYHEVPAEEDLYGLFLSGASVYRRDVLAVIDQKKRIRFQERRLRQVKLAKKNGLMVREEKDFSAFWRILEENLLNSYGVKPVHSLQEIQILQKRFSQNIRLHICTLGHDVVAGVVIYETTKVAHVQYISANERGKELGALDLVFDTILENEYKSKTYFDFGISNEENGRFLNRGLIEQKEGFGARAVVHDCYELLLS